MWPNLKDSKVNKRVSFFSRMSPFLNVLPWARIVIGEQSSLNDLLKSRVSVDLNYISTGLDSSKDHPAIAMDIRDAEKMISRPTISGFVPESPVSLKLISSQNNNDYNTNFDLTGNPGTISPAECMWPGIVYDVGVKDFDPNGMLSLMTMVPNRHIYLITSTNSGDQTALPPIPDDNGNMGSRYSYNKGSRRSDIINRTPLNPMEVATSNCNNRFDLRRGRGSFMSDPALDELDYELVRGQMTTQLDHPCIVNSTGRLSMTRTVTWNMFSTLRTRADSGFVGFIPLAVFTKYFSIGSDGKIKDCQLFPSQDAQGNAGTMSMNNFATDNLKATSFRINRSKALTTYPISGLFRMRMRQQNIVDQSIPSRGIAGSFTMLSKVFMLINGLNYGNNSSMTEFITAMYEDVFGSSLLPMMDSVLNPFGTVILGNQSRTDWVATDEAYAIIADDYVVGIPITYADSPSEVMTRMASRGKYGITSTPSELCRFNLSLSAVTDLDMKIGSRSSSPLEAELHIPYSQDLSTALPGYGNAVLLQACTPSVVLHTNTLKSDIASDYMASIHEIFMARNVVNPNIPELDRVQNLNFYLNSGFVPGVPGVNTDVILTSQPAIDIGPSIFFGLAGRRTNQARNS